MAFGLIMARHLSGDTLKLCVTVLLLSEKEKRVAEPVQLKGTLSSLCSANR